MIDLLLLEASMNNMSSHIEADTNVSRLKSYLRKIPFLVRILIVLCIIVVLFIVLFPPKQEPLPEEFVRAREEAALVSKKIVQLTSVTNQKIKEIQVSRVAEDGGRALQLVKEAKDDNAEAYNNAFELSRHLQKLAESLADFSSFRTQRLAYEAVAVELSLVSEFITYTQNLNVFLDGLQRAIERKTLAEKGTILKSLSDVNKNANKINKLNEEFLGKMRKFDSSF
ncbi:hypothetical protein A3A21_04230 [Candidatus Jorgensenbacteria bacterium RIFCSPLOWO2_01_FULL_45_25b]|uniref:Uncharacterized protein n=2 Tax=Parcubacteria group TaxID=1794811 RepID=A0A1F6BWK2_9BACT|nr:MAG: hypothetical protein A3A21_04230 [Candidatus Jorgensenbacteria bacterium RIFCSPLOWO2_01_FULL_45_25b]